MQRVATGWVAVVFLSVGVPAFGQDKPTADKNTAEQDKKVATLIYETVKEGVELYNGGNVEGCLRLYQGSLMVLGGVLDRREETARAIKDALAKAKTEKTADAAFTLRKALDNAQADVSPPKKADPEKKPLWERLGGQKAVEAVVHDFVGLAATDPKVNFFRNGTYKLDDAGVKKFEGMLVDMISQATGGPGKYTGRTMKDSHKGMKITEAEFAALAADLVATLEKYKVGKAEIDELVAIVAGTKPDIVEVK